MTHASLFPGIGGFDLAAEWAGWTNAFNCEIDPFCRTILKHHFPNAKQYEDIRTSDFSEWRGRIDVLTGGFPCQPFSLAGQRKGTEDDRYLWPAMLDVIRTVRPRWVVGENVYGIVNWSDGMVFEQVCADLEAAGYEVQPYIIPACGVGAPHRRERVWFVAHCCGFSSDTRRPNATGQFWETRPTNGVHDAENPHRIRRERQTYTEKEPKAGQQRTAGAGDSGRICGTTGTTSDCSDARTENLRESKNRAYATGYAADAGRELPEKWHSEREGGRRESPLATEPSRGTGVWGNFPTQSPIRCRDDGFPGGLDADTIFTDTRPQVIGKLLTYSKWREQSIKAYGNAIVPQVVYQIFETINNFETL